MATPQSGIFAELAPHHFFLEYSVPLPKDPKPVVAAIRRAREAAAAGAGVRLVTAFGSGLWHALAPKQTPALLRPFQTMEGARGKRVPGTQNDLWLWLSGEQRDAVFHAAAEAGRVLGALATLRQEVQGFKYLDSRDLTGFVDGTANPTGAEAREAGLVPAGETGAGGSFVIAQRWIHDLAAFHALPVAEQERVIGRRKPDSEELADAEKPPTAHIARVEVEQDGEELAIFRRSIPYGGLGEHGLYFLAFSREPTRFDIMLRRMFGLAGDGLEDRLTDFSRPVASAYYFAPAEEALQAALK